MRRLILGPLAITTALLLASCGSDEPTTGSTAPAPSVSAGPSTGASPSESTSSEPDSTVAPATGPLITGPGATLNAPADWTMEVDPDSTGGAILGPNPLADFLALSDLEGPVSDPSVDALAKLDQQVSSIKPQLARQPDVTIAGMPAFHLAGEDKGFVRWTEKFGFFANNNLITIIIGSPMDQPQAERDATSAAILASVKLTG